MFVRWLTILAVLLTVNIANSLRALDDKGRFKVIAFDFGSVIAKANWQEVASFVAQSLHISEKEATEVLQKLKEQTKKGEKEQDFWLAYAYSKNIKLPDNWQEQLDKAKLQAIKVIPGMIELVLDLKKHGYQTALLSNTSKNQADIKRKLGYYNLFNPVLLSYEIGVRKPNPEAYKILLSKLQVPAEAVLFIDNQLKNVEAAKSLGIEGIVFVDRDQLVPELRKKGVEISY